MGLVLVNLTPIWVASYFPSQNGPWFLLTSHMFVEYDNPKWDFSEYYVRNWHPIPHMLHDALIAAVACVLPILVAEKLILTLYVILVPTSVFYFLSVVSKAAEPLGYVAFAFVHNYCLYRGYCDFTISIPLFFFTLAIWYRGRHAITYRRAAALATLGLLVYLAHLFTFVLLAGTIGWLHLVETRSLTKSCRMAFLVTWPAWPLLVDYVALSSHSTWLDVSDVVWLPLQWRFENVARKFFYSISYPAYVIGVSTCVAIWLVAAVNGRAYLAKPLRHLAGAFRDPFGSLWILLACAYIMLPCHFLGWHMVDIRLLPFIYVFSLACVARMPHVFSGSRTSVVVTTIVVLAVVGTATCITYSVLAMNRLLADYVSGVQVCDRNSRILPIHLENPAFGQVKPLTRAHEYYHLARGGANGHSVARYNTLSMMWYRHYPVEDIFPPYDPANPRMPLAEVAMRYDVALVWGNERNLDSELRAGGMNLVYEQGKIHVWKRTAQSQ